MIALSVGVLDREQLIHLSNQRVVMRAYSIDRPRVKHFPFPFVIA